MIDKNSKVAIALKDRKLMDLVQTEIIKSGINAVIQFSGADEAYETLSRQQVDLIIVGIQMPDKPGVTLMQRLRACGNYGEEPFLFVGEKIDSPTLELFLEYDVDYVLTPPFDKNRAAAKIKFLIDRENNVPEELAAYRSAKNAFVGNIYDMAESFALGIVDHEKIGEKAKILLGEIAAAQGQNEKAIKLFTEVIKANPKSVNAVHKLAKAHMAISNFEQAKVYLDNLVDQNPHHIAALEGAGLTNHELGNDELAKKQLSKLENLDCTNQCATETQTKIAIKEGNFDGIAGRLKRTHSEKEIVSMLNNAGIKLSKDEDFQGAINIYEECLKAVRKKDFIGKIAYNLAIAYKNLGNNKKAAFYCQKSFEAFPELRKAKKMLDELQAA